MTNANSGSTRHSSLPYPWRRTIPRSREAVVAAHVPLARGARRARDRIGAADDADHEVAGPEARAGWCLEHLAQALVADDQLPLRAGFAVGAVGDLPVGAAHADQPPAHQQRAILLGRLGDLLDADAPLPAWQCCDRAHGPMLSVMATCVTPKQRMPSAGAAAILGG